jgi:hypothetical protein
MTATGDRAVYTGRAVAASTATGNKYVHIAELHSFLAEALVGRAVETKSHDGGEIQCTVP